LIVPKASKSEKNMGLDNFEVKQKDERTDIGKGSFTEKGLQPGKNSHPTVKPIDLMSYLVVLGSRKDDVILDPFAGSGTTGIACVFSERNYILIEREKEYFKIMEARIKKAKNPADLVQHEWF
jgi:site-specific DNA-methyltransferase (adenine-specific)